jgi:hypothetical protein
MAIRVDFDQLLRALTDTATDGGRYYLHRETGAIALHSEAPAEQWVPMPQLSQRVGAESFSILSGESDQLINDFFAAHGIDAELV